MKELADASILVVDDDVDHLAQLKRALTRGGCRTIHTTADPFGAAQLHHELQPDMMLLDYRMPPIDGFFVLDELWHGEGPDEECPVIMITAGADDSVRVKALEMGVSDFLEHPSDYIELLLRVRNVLRIHGLYRQVHQQVSHLDELVRLRTAQLEEASLEIFDRLVLASEFRDDGTGEHARRVGIAAEAIGRQLGLSAKMCALLLSAARLHDLGKLGIPDSVLFKPGPLSDDEFEIVRTHPEIGGAVLAGCHHPLLVMAHEIATSHHERWDGRGYPAGLAGDKIPLSGRIVAVADAYDVMTSNRAYRDAQSRSFAIAEIRRGRGAQFDPAVVDAFLGCFAERDAMPVRCMPGP